MAGKGKDYYKSTYTHEQLWDMLNEGDDWAVEQGASVWTSAASGMKAAREEMVTHVQSLRTQWTGSASEEFEYRMSVIEDYSTVSEDGMKQAGEHTFPALAQALKTAQSDAYAADLYPTSTESYDDWLESNGIDKTKPEYEAKKTQYEEQFEAYVDARHEQIAQIVADLGGQYAVAAEEIRLDTPEEASDEMPGSSTYQKPTGGVFATDTLSSSDDTSTGPGGTDGSDSTDSDGIGGTDDDLDPVSSDWSPSSYTDVDGDLTGGLASGGVSTSGGTYTAGMSGSTAGVGGSSLSTAGAGLFGTNRGATTTSGTGSTTGRGSGSGSGRSSSAARSGASSSSSRSGTGSGSRGTGSGRTGSTSGSRNSSSGRGGTRSGYDGDDDEDEYTRETWLREDDVDWGRNRRDSDEELDD